MQIQSSDHQAKRYSEHWVGNVYEGQRNRWVSYIHEKCEADEQKPHSRRFDKYPKNRGKGRGGDIADINLGSPNEKRDSGEAIKVLSGEVRFPEYISEFYTLTQTSE